MIYNRWKPIHNKKIIKKKKERNQHYFWLVPQYRKNSLDGRVEAISKGTHIGYYHYPNDKEKEIKGLFAIKSELYMHHLLTKLTVGYNPNLLKV